MAPGQRSPRGQVRVSWCCCCLSVAGVSFASSSRILALSCWQRSKSILFRMSLSLRASPAWFQKAVYRLPEGFSFPNRWLDEDQTFLRSQSAVHVRRTSPFAWLMALRYRMCLSSISAA